MNQSNLQDQKTPATRLAEQDKDKRRVKTMESFRRKDRGKRDGSSGAPTTTYFNRFVTKKDNQMVLAQQTLLEITKRVFSVLKAEKSLANKVVFV